MTTLGVARPTSPRQAPTAPRLAREVAWAASAIGTASAAGLLLREHLTAADLAMLMLLAVVVVAARTSRSTGIGGAVLAIVAYDLLFVTPYYRLSVSDAAYLITFAVMLIVALAIGHLTSRLREVALVRQERERIASARLALSERLADAATPEALATESARFLADETGSAVRVLLTPADTAVESVLEALALPVADHGLRDGVVAVLQGGAPHQLTVDSWMVHRIHDGVRIRGVATLEPGQQPGDLMASAPLVDAVLGQLALLLERREASRRHAAVRLEVEAERLRIALLSAVSHDLRTPLAAIEGAASTLLTGSAPLPDPVRRGLLESIEDEARRMNRLIGNLLDMVRVETGALVVHRSWQPIEEVIGVTLLRMEDRLGDRRVEVTLPRDLPLVAIDELLLEHVFINLLENALRHAPGEGPIEITGRARDDGLEISVRDHGPGIPVEVLPTVFERFRRGERPEPGHGGLGLGLSICRGIVEAHGGSITAGNHPEGGAVFTIVLPVGGAPAAPLDEEGETW